MLIARSLITASLLFAVTLPSAAAPQTPDVQPLLDQGQTDQAEALLVKHLDTQPDDQDARLALGTIRMMQALQSLTAEYYQYGPKPTSLPMFRIPVPFNNNPQPIRHGDLQKVLDRFVDKLAGVEQTLAPIGDQPAKWVLRLDTVHLDFDGNGEIENNEKLARVIDRLAGGALRAARRRAVRLDTQPATQPNEPFTLVMALDNTDAYWMRAYTHLLRGFVETLLAHDTRELFNHTGHLFFAKPQTPYPFLANRDDKQGWDFNEIVDFIAMIHLINLPVESPDRLKSALAHFQQTIRLSRVMWESAKAETDNDREWLPAPGQDSVIPARIDEDRLAAWMNLLDETEAVLAGEKLIPFWRTTDEPVGVNLHRAFTEPRRFDLVLWVQGTAAVPYLEDDKPLTTGAFWSRINQQFGGNLMGFAIFIN